MVKAIYFFKKDSIAAITVLRWKFIAYLKREEKSQIHNLNL